MNQLNPHEERGTPMLTKERVFEIVSKADEGDRASRIFDGVIMSLIGFSIVAIILESFASIAQRYQLAFRIFEYISVSVFTLEYILRIWTADFVYPNAPHPKLKYITSLNP